jgi:SAM-dependent methyltransferase
MPRAGGAAALAGSAGARQIAPRDAASAGSGERSASWSTIRFVGLTVLLVGAYYSVLGLLLESDLIAAVAHQSAAVAGLIMTAVGVQVEVEAGLLRTASAAFLVTPECVLTPVIPVWLAAVLAAPLAPARRAMAVVATLPLFLGLGTARLLILAVPATLIGSSLVGVHAFYQMIAALLAVGMVARRAGGPVGLGILRGLGVGGVVGVALGWLDLRWLRPALGEVTAALHVGHGWVDDQGALAILPAFQLGLLAALLAAAWKRGIGVDAAALVRGVTLLVASQLAFTVVVGELAAHADYELPIVLVRLWSLAVPLAVFGGVELSARGRPGAATERGRYLDFWNRLGETFPDLGGAASTDYYLENERLLFEQFLPDLDGSRIFKTDLWDEARNTRILRWAAGRGARVHGADISLPTTVDARRELASARLALGGAVGDVRAVPFRDGVFDAVYSMGTIEHFAETEQAVGEIYRVTAPGGRAIIGVPNRHDPFLRPLLVAILRRLGLYAYGMEKSYSRRELRSMCESAGFQVVAETGILFMPGWLRMLDLTCHVWARPLARLTGLATRPFAWLYRTFPRLRRHGYLIAVVATRPGGSTSTSCHAAEPSTKQ